jgi:anti-anti-sigma factor
LTFVVNLGEPAPNCAVLHLRGELDMATAGLVDECAQDLLSDRSNLIIDLSAVSFLAAAGLGVLVRADDRTRANRGCLRVVTGHSRAAPRALAITQLDRTLTVHTTPRDAVEAMTRP